MVTGGAAFAGKGEPGSRPNNSAEKQGAELEHLRTRL